MQTTDMDAQTDKVKKKPQRKKNSRTRQVSSDGHSMLPNTATTAGGSGTSHSSPVGPPRGDSPTGANWYPISSSSTSSAYNQTSASYGYFPGPHQHPMATPAGYVGLHQHPMATPAGYVGPHLLHSMGPPMPSPMGPPMQHPGYMSSQVGLSMPTPQVNPQVVQDDVQDDADPDDGDFDADGGDIDADGGDIDVDGGDADDTSSEEEVVDPDTRKRRKVIRPCGNVFLKSNTGSQAVTQVIKKYYLTDYRGKLTDISEDVEKECFRLFSTIVAWKDEDEEEIKRIFWLRMSKQLSDWCYKLRKKNVCPKYMGENVWKKYKAAWEDDGWKGKSEKAKQNRASEKGGSLHCHGSVNLPHHAHRLARKAGRPLTIPELHRATHLRKNNKEYVEERARKTQEKHAELMFEPTQGTWNPDSLAPLSPEMVAIANNNWKKAAGPSTKNRLYGAGPLAPLVKFSNHYDTSSSSGRHSHASSAETQQLRQHVERLEAEQQRLVAEQQRKDETIAEMQANQLRMQREQERLFALFTSLRPHESSTESDHPPSPY